MFPRFAFCSLFTILSVSIFISCNSRAEKAEKNPIIKNRLANSSSPYLKEHADNPVDWYEWGSEALSKAKKEDKPVIISIGYAACHWCHVMEEESFMDTTVAAIMNKDFVSIKVDREQRPDIDKLYMDAAQLLNGESGWPLNVIALPDGRPFFAGTYFPSDQWKKVLTTIANSYQKDKSDFVQTASALTQGIKKVNSLDTIFYQKVKFSKNEYQSIITQWREKWDERRGGYEGRQKFPLAVSWDALLEYYYLTQNEQVLQFINTTLTKMAKGGIYDQLGGGFHRYTTDTKWNIPHFEKMLYDNAQLISLYSKAYKVTGNPEFAKVVRETIDFVERELSNGEGGYYSSMNADSEGEEGKYYVWTEKNLKRLLSKEEADLVLGFYNVTPYGNWENGKNVLYRNYSLSEYAKKTGLTISEVQNVLQAALTKMKEEREDRPKPSIDEKTLTSWNALMIDAYLDAFTALGEREYLKRAERTANFLKKQMISRDYALWRNYNNGRKEVNGFLNDYSFLSSAYLHLYQVSFDKNWLEIADKLTHYSLQHFNEGQHALLYFSMRGGDELISRNFELEDNVMPSSNSVMAENLFLLGELTGRKEYLTRSEKMLQVVKRRVEEQPFLYANWTKLVGLKAYGIHEVAIMGQEAMEKNFQLQKEYLPTSVFMGGKEENLPLLEAKLVPGKTLIYVCQNKTCKYPVADSSEALGLLKSNQSSSNFSNFIQ